MHELQGTIWVQTPSKSLNLYSNYLLDRSVFFHDRQFQTHLSNVSWEQTLCSLILKSTTMLMNYCRQLFPCSSFLPKSYPFYFLNSLDSTPYFTLASLCQPHTPVIDSLLLIHSPHGCKDVSLPVLIGNSLFPSLLFRQPPKSSKQLTRFVISSFL